MFSVTELRCQIYRYFTNFGMLFNAVEMNCTILIFACYTIGQFYGSKAYYTSKSPINDMCRKTHQTAGYFRVSQPSSVFAAYRRTYLLQPRVSSGLDSQDWR
jgi:hypothetical protein